MSHHFVEGPDHDEPRIEIGWDQPLMSFFIDIYDPRVDDDMPAVSKGMLDGTQLYGFADLLKVLADLGIEDCIPDECRRELFMDRDLGRMNTSKVFGLVMTGGTWTPYCVTYTGGLSDQPCWCGACEPPDEPQGCAHCGTEDTGRCVVYRGKDGLCDDCIENSEQAIWNGRDPGELQARSDNR
jgi:hypothetical protein